MTTTNTPHARYDLPQWHQGHDHWTLLHLKLWLPLPNWSAAQATALLLGIDPRRDNSDTLELMDGVSVPSRGPSLKEREFVIKVRDLQEKFAIIARAHNMDQASPAEWIEFAESVELVPAWKQLAIDNGLLPSGVALDATSPEVDDPTIPATPESWQVVARRLADDIALTRYNSGLREITGRNICDAVAAELAKQTKYNSHRGPHDGSTIRTHALKGWKFVPPSGTSGTNGTSE